MTRSDASTPIDDAHESRDYRLRSPHGAAGADLGPMAALLAQAPKVYGRGVPRIDPDAGGRAGL